MVSSQVSSEQALLVPQSEIDAFVPAASASHQSEFPDGLPVEYSATGLPISNSDAQRQPAKEIIRTTNEIPSALFSQHGKCAKRNMKYDREYMIDNILQHVGGLMNELHVKRCNGYITADDTIEPSTSIP